MFKIVDTDNDGQISIMLPSNEELGAFASQAGSSGFNLLVDMYHISKTDLKSYICMMDKDNDGQISIDEFLDGYKKKLAGIDYDEEIREAFKVFDTDGNNKISISEIKKILTRASPPIPEQEIALIIKEIDKYNDGNFHYQEFIDTNSFS
ncbi:unnamed protein product [Moneuplotes crassus]|uniref:EF-hand domain-containing protein n=1 Tax=Euplotes crassus TaxID=5936 RepID=A0AAD2D1W1_EUPCR|nr:unnamed protein product [Moneuplotes crassus]